MKKRLSTALSTKALRDFRASLFTAAILSHYNINMTLDEKYMKMCFKLARKGEGKVSPNPLVGCVVLNKEGKVVSKGYHKKYGESHAERDALNKIKVGEAEGGTLYVNLEPCSHYGKTPPCTEIIIRHKIKKVVYALKDPNPIINGKNELKKAGIEIVEGVLENEAKFLNRVFLKNINKNLPYVVIKTATTMDGKIATKTGASKWITSEKSRDYAKKLRQKFDCIMTTSNTVIADNPNMKHKFKCILDKDLRTDKNSNIYKQGEIYIASKNNTPLKNGYLDIKFVLKELYKKGIRSVFIEAGGTFTGAVLKEGLADEIYQFVAPKILNDNEGLGCFNGNECLDISKCVDLKICEIKNLNPDLLIKAIIK